MINSLIGVCDSPVGKAGLQILLGRELKRVGKSELVSAENFEHGLIVRLRAAGNNQEYGVSTNEIAHVLEIASGRVLVLTESVEFDVYARLYGIGVEYALSCSASEQELRQMLDACLLRSKVHGGHFESVKRILDNPGFSSFDARNLTPRESSVAAAMTAGLTNKQIARAFGISYETVKEHVQHILRKLDVKDRTRAAVKLAKDWNPTLCL